MTNLVTHPLPPREAVADALHRCILGLDSNDRELFESACVKNETMTVIAGEFNIEGWTAINDFFQKDFALLTTHTVSNIRVNIKDDKTAFMTAHTLSYHIRPEDAFKPEDSSYTGSCLYSIDLVKDENDGLWKIQKWIINLLWSTGDKAVLHG